MLKTGFPPIASLQARILVLGSLPSEASIAAQQYYAHPRNAFWPIMMQITSGDLSWPYAARAAHLAASGVVVWDVMAAAEREGSLDSAIDTKSMQLNDFAGLFAEYPNISHVFFNGGKAEQSFKKVDLSEKLQNALNFQRLPSTSPAYASLSPTQKLAIWQSAFHCTGQVGKG